MKSQEIFNILKSRPKIIQVYLVTYFSSLSFLFFKVYLNDTFNAESNAENITFTNNLHFAFSSHRQKISIKNNLRKNKDRSKVEI